jgi:hypothetical protein
MSNARHLTPLVLKSQPVMTASSGTWRSGSDIGFPMVVDQ